MTLLAFIRDPRRSTAVRIVAVALVSATLMSAFIGRLGRRIDQRRMEQTHIANLREQVTNVVGDLDSVLLGESAVSAGPHLRQMDATFAQIVAVADSDTAGNLSLAYQGFTRAIRKELIAFQQGGRTLGSVVDKQETDPSLDRLRTQIDRLGDVCQSRAEDERLATMGAVVFALFSSAILVSLLMIRHRARSESLAALEVRRLSAESSEGRFRFLYELAEAKRGVTDPYALTEIMIGFLARHLGASSAVFVLQPVGRPLVEYVYDPCGQADREVWRSRMDGRLSQILIQSELTLDSNCGTASDDASANLRSFGIGAYVCSPVVRDGEVKAAVLMFQNETRAWTPDEAALIEEIAARCFARLMQAEAEAAARRSEEHVRFVFDALSTGVWEWDFESGQVVWSLGMYTLLGVSQEEFSPSVEAMRGFVVAEDAEELAAVLAQGNDESYSARIRIHASDGRVLSILAQGQTQFDAGGKPIRSVGTFTDLTRLSEAKEAQREVEHVSRWTRTLLEAQVNSSPDGILIVDPQGKKILQNRRMTEVWGVPMELGDELDDKRQLALVVEKTQDPVGFLAIVRHLYAHPEKSQRDEIELVDGRIIERYSAPARGTDGTVYGRIWTFRDVTERIESERTNQRIEHQSRWMSAALEAQMNASSEGIIIVDTNNRRILQNRRFAQVWGLPEDLIDDEDDDRQFAMVCDAVKDLDAFTSVFSELKAFPETVYRGEIELKNGTVLERYSSPAAGTDGAVLGRIWTFRDVTERILAERALREAHEELEIRVEQRTADLVAATSSAERANAAKSEFLSRISHELRTPLNAILGFGQILQRQSLDALQQESVEFIVKGGRHLLGLINEVLDISRVESGHSELSIEPLPVAEVIAESLAMVRTMAADRGIVLDEGGLPDLETHVLADRQRFKQVLINLLSNAVKYNRPGGRVTARCQEDEGRLRIAIEDTGTGLSPEDLSKLFTPFERLGASVTEIEGTGLGLFLSQRLVAAMGGELLVESAVDVGSVFTVVLDVAQAPTEAFGLVAAGLAEPGGTEDHDRSYSILSIEDNSANVRLLQAIFAKRGDIVLSTAAEGAAGFEKARSEEPDLILLDLTLPDVSGIDVLKRLKRSGATRHIPVIVVSADSGEDKVRASLEAGALRFLPKPLDVHAFRRAVDESLGRTSPNAEEALPIAA